MRKLRQTLDLIRQKADHLKALQQNGRPIGPLVREADEDYPVIVCQNCHTEFHGNYCPQCGQRASTSRITLRTAIEHALSLFTNVESGFLRTCLELCYRPGYLIRDYLNGHRASYSKPLSLLFVLATVQFVVRYLLYWNSGTDLNWEINIEDSNSQSLNQLLEYLHQIFLYLSTNAAATTLLNVIFLVFTNYLVYRLTPLGKRLNLAEHFYIMLFVGCQFMILNILQIPYHRLMHLDDELFFYGSGLTFLLAVWDFRQLYSLTWRKSLRLYLLSYLLSILLFIVIVILILALYFVVLHPEVRAEIMDR